MIERVIIAGAGGQGVMLLGKVLACAAVKENKHVTWLPSYGAEVRGGAAYCMVTISDEEIDSPCIEKADTLIIMRGACLPKFKRLLRKNGLLIINSSFAVNDDIKNINVRKHPFTDIAVKLGNIKLANMVALGCFAESTGVVDLKSVLEVIDEVAPLDKKQFVEINRKAALTGKELARKSPEKLLLPH